MDPGTSSERQARGQFKRTVLGQVCGAFMRTEKYHVCWFESVNEVLVLALPAMFTARSAYAMSISIFIVLLSYLFSTCCRICPLSARLSEVRAVRRRQTRLNARFRSSSTAPFLNSRCPRTTRLAPREESTKTALR